MDNVTQQNASGAEESASASEQLSAQAQTVKGMVDELSALVGGESGNGGATSTATSPRKAKKQHKIDVAHPKKPATVPVGASAGGYGDTKPGAGSGPADYEFMALDDKGLNEF